MYSTSLPTNTGQGSTLFVSLVPKEVLVDVSVDMFSIVNCGSHKFGELVGLTKRFFELLKSVRSPADSVVGNWPMDTMGRSETAGDVTDLTCCDC